jgi:hypothetical protein
MVVVVGGGVGKDEGHGGLRQVAAADQPLVVLFQQQHPGQPQQRGVVGEDADHVGAPADLAVGPAPAGWWSATSTSAGLGRRRRPAGQPRRPRASGPPWERGAELVGDLAEPLASLSGRGGGEDLADRAGDQRLLRSWDVAEHVAQEMDGAALPGQPNTLAIAVVSPV